MFFEIEGVTYIIRFRYNGTTTLCEFFRVEKNGTLHKMVGEGVAVLYFKDTYNEAKGRMVALADLLWKYSVQDEEGEIPEGLNREDRITIWNEYFESFRK